MNRRNFLKSMFIFTGALWIPKMGIARMSPAIVGAGKLAAGGAFSGNLLHETFDGAVSCALGDVNTCDITWIEEGAVDFDNTIDPPIGETGFVSKCAFFDGSGWEPIYIRKTLASPAAIVWVTFHVYFTDVSNVGASNASIAKFLNSSDGVAAQLGVINSTGIKFQYTDGSGHTDLGPAVAINTAYRVDLYYNNTTSVLSWSIDGVDQGSVPSASLGSDCAKLEFGACNAGSYAHALYIDNIDADTTEYAP